MRLSNDQKVEGDHNVLYHKEMKNKNQPNNKAITNLIMSFDLLFTWTDFSFHYVLSYFGCPHLKPLLFLFHRITMDVPLSFKNSLFGSSTGLLPLKIGQVKIWESYRIWKVEKLLSFSLLPFFVHYPHRGLYFCKSR